MDKIQTINTYDCKLQPMSYYNIRCGRVVFQTIKRTRVEITE